MTAKSHRDPAPYGIVAAYQGLAAARLGRNKDAYWYWIVALNLLLDFDRQELAAAYELEPELLPLEIPRLIPPGRCPNRARPPRLSGKPVAHPILLGPYDRSVRAVHGFSAQAVVGVEGRLHSPRLLTPAADTGGDIAYGGLEAMRELRFVPGHSKRQAVECPFRLSTTFHSHSSR